MLLAIYSPPIQPSNTICPSNGRCKKAVPYSYIYMQIFYHSHHFKIMIMPSLMFHLHLDRAPVHLYLHLYTNLIHYLHLDTNPGTLIYTLIHKPHTLFTLRYEPGIHLYLHLYTNLIHYLHLYTRLTGTLYLHLHIYFYY